MPEEAATWVGCAVDELGGRQVGKVEAVYGDASSQAPEWLLVRTSRAGNRRLVPGRDAVAANGRLWVPYSRDAIRGAPKAPKTKRRGELTRQSEQELLAHYGVGAEVGRAAEIAALDAGTATALPL